MTAYVPYLDLAAAIGLQPKDRVYLSSDLMALAWNARQHGETFCADALLDSFQKQITEEGTLLVPAFHFSFSNQGTYDYKHTPSAAGALGNTALQRTDFQRTAHPMHSFCVWGKDKDRLCALRNRNSFGCDSPFAYMEQNQVIQVMLGTDYQRSMTFVHYVEYMAGVPYRFLKQFTGSYRDENGAESIRTYEYPARDLELGSVEKFNRIGKILEDQGIAECLTINGIMIRKVMLAESYPVIYQDAKYNQCRNLYDFEADRAQIWADLQTGESRTGCQEEGGNEIGKRNTAKFPGMGKGVSDN